MEPLHRRYSRKIIIRLATLEGSSHPPPVCTDPSHLDIVVLPLKDEPTAEVVQPHTSTSRVLSPMDVLDDDLDSVTDRPFGKNTSGEDSSGTEAEQSCDEDGDIEMEDGDDAGGDDEDDCRDIETEAGAKAVLESSGFVVDSTYRAIVCIDCHAVIRHKDVRVIGKRGLELCVMRLQADRPRYPSPDSEAIRRVEHLKVDMFWGCGNHGKTAHCDLSWMERRPVQVPGHCFTRMKRESLYVRVDQSTKSSTLPSDGVLALILQHSKARGLGDSQKELVVSDKRELTEVLYHGEWVKMLQDVAFVELIEHAIAPKKNEPNLLRLRDSVRRYYHAIPPILSQIGKLTKEQIVSHTLEHNDFQYFKEPQNDDSLIRDADEMTHFLTFHLRCMWEPIANFPVHLHPVTREKLELLYSTVEQADTSTTRIDSLLHDAIWSFLSCPVPEYLKDDIACPLTRYLVAVHLQTSRGRFAKPRFIPPTLSKLQYAFRATACRHIVNIRSEFGDETNRAYVEAVQPFLIAGKATLFHSLKQSHAFYTTLTKNEPGFARFNWDLDYKVLSVDGHPVLMTDFADSITGCVDTLQMRIHRLFRGCDYQDILDHISARLDPSNPRMWLQDDPLNSEYGESLITNTANGFKAFGPHKEDLTVRLLNHLSHRPELVSQKMGNDGQGKLQISRGNVMDWICELNECVKLLYYLITATWGGGARGTEMTPVQHSNTVNDRHVFVFNGMLTIVTNYVKTKSIQGHGVRVARCPSFVVSRLLILLVTTVYPAATHMYMLVKAGSSNNSSDFYESHLFVLSGRRMVTDDFSETTREITSTYLGAPLGVSSWRQFMHTMLVNLAKVDFTSSDQLDEEVQHVHAMFAHTKEVGQQHYSIQISNALADISSTSVSSNQRISIRWHGVNNLLHPNHLAKVKSENVAAGFEPDAPSFAHISDTIHDVTRAATTNVLASIERQTAELKSTLQESNERLMINSMAYTHTRLVSDSNHQHPTTNTVAIQVHPHLFEEVRSVVPSGSTYFCSPQQAELVQSTLGRENILAIMPTGSGKSLAFFSAPCLVPEGLFLVVTPLTALTEDMDRRLRQNHGVRGGIYPSFSDMNGQLVFVAAHQAGTDKFLGWVEKQESRLRRIFIDECHHVYASSTYQACFRLFHKLTKMKKPFTFLSSTVLPQSIPLLCRAMAITQETLRIIRAPIARPNISYSVTHVPDEKDLIERVTTFCRNFTLGADHRGIIYTRTIADAKLLADALGCDYYVSKVDLDEETNTMKKRANIKRWQEGEEAKNRWIVGTQCLGEGIDQSNVRITVHANVTTLIDLVQQTGRAGRDGKLSHSFVFWSQLPWNSQKEGQRSIIPDDWDDYYDVVVGPEHYGIDELILFLQANHQCRRFHLVQSHDGEAHSCAAIGGALCDNCQTLLGRISVLGMCQDANFKAPLASGK
ncbi:hypothetical protein EDD18DRAFT_1366707 [Armillaria luteobubalina]|uniref:DNA 3'-5' helicase n=1 Tax=Armillaria luteobubalina TaxID=153913 RepID=A0AA39P2V2_9AGAR|nr:hypothetical protein EDD18DRAFT_1366707 [Armillaria luteobubalina]